MNGQNIRCGSAYCPMASPLVVGGEGAGNLQSVTPPTSALDVVVTGDWDLSDLTRLHVPRQLPTGAAADVGATLPSWGGTRGEYFSKPPASDAALLAWSVSRTPEWPRRRP